MPLLSGQKIRPAQTPGWVAEDIRTTSSGTFTTTETVLQWATFTAVNVARHKITALQGVQSTAAGDLIRVRLRWEGGGTLTTGGTQLLALLPNADIATKGTLLTMVATVTGLTGSVSMGVTAVRDTGTGTISSFGAAGRQEHLVLVERV